VSKKVFIKTFGCQMNEYDSDKMADVMKAAEGYEPTQNVDEADLILFNTCSVRERAQEKVFSDLGRVKHLKEKGVLIGVGGCVASQEGADIIKTCALCRRGVWPAGLCTACPNYWPLAAPKTTPSRYLFSRD
jgi:tRNA-2-methylthio-N6-dimethylallyladenosine synthase